MSTIDSFEMEEGFDTQETQASLIDVLSEVGQKLKNQKYLFGLGAMILIVLAMALPSADNELMIIVSVALIVIFCVAIAGSIISDARQRVKRRLQSGTNLAISDQAKIKEAVLKKHVRSSNYDWKYGFLADKDPISKRPIDFDGYRKTPTKETFYTVRFHSQLNSGYLDKLHNMLSLIYFYNKNSKTKASLELILLNLPVKYGGSPRYKTSIENLRDAFEPALKDLLSIKEKEEFTLEEIEGILSES